MKLFSSDGKGGVRDIALARTRLDKELLTRLVAEEVKKYLGK